MDNIGTYYWEGEERTYSYKTTLTANEKVSFISTVMSLLFQNDDDGNEYYLNVLFELFFDYALVLVFSDIDNFDIMGEDEDGNIKPLDLDVVEEFLTETLVANTIKLNIDSDLEVALKDGLEDALAYKTGINKNEVGYAIAHLLRTVELQLGDFNFEEMKDSLNSLLQDMPSLSEEKIVDAYINKTLVVDGNDAEEDSSEQVTIEEVIEENKKDDE